MHSTPHDAHSYSPHVEHSTVHPTVQYRTERTRTLADTKAILSGGRVWCVGSSEWLRTRLGLGYTLTCDAIRIDSVRCCVYSTVV